MSFDVISHAANGNYSIMTVTGMSIGIAEHLDQTFQDTSIPGMPWVGYYIAIAIFQIKLLFNLMLFYIEMLTSSQRSGLL